MSTSSIDMAAHNKAHSKRIFKKYASRTVSYVVLSIVTLIFFAPIYYLFVGSLKPDNKVLNGLKGFIPESLSFNNYGAVFDAFKSDDTGHFYQFYLTSVTVSAIVVIGGLIVNSMAAYALARLRWSGQKFVLAFTVLLVILPFEAIAVPLFDLLSGFRNTLMVQSIPFIANAFSIYLFYSFFIGLPAEIQEAAKIDGASSWRIYRQIVVPMSKPVFGSVTILSFLAAWNSFLWPLMMVDEHSISPLPLAMSVFYQQQTKHWGVVFAFGVLLVLPVVLIFLAFQRYFIQSVASSAVKG